MNLMMNKRMISAAVAGVIALAVLPVLAEEAPVAEQAVTTSTAEQSTTTEQPAGVAQSAYASPEEAAKALYDAIQSGEVNAIYQVLGPGSSDLIYTGDEVADKKMFKRFITSYDKSHKLESKSDAESILLVGENDWPFPFPLVKNQQQWQFDASAGAEEIINRRVGENELFAMEFCLAYGDAQREYFEVDRDGDGLLEYAQRVRSSEGKQDGLYWPTADGEPLSPLGVMAAEAVEEGYDLSQDEAPAPYHGYIYRPLTAQGTYAPGGAYDYKVDGNMIGGFALVAYPANWGSSGVMTFVCNHDGVVFESNLGEETSDAVSRITHYNPGSEWKKVALETKPE